MNRQEPEKAKEGGARADEADGGDGGDGGEGGEGGEEEGGGGD